MKKNVAESGEIGESGGVFQTEKTPINSLSRVFLGNFVPSQNLPRVFVPYSDGPGLNERDFREEFAQIRQHFAKLRLKTQPDSMTNPNADNSATSTPIKEMAL